MAHSIPEGMIACKYCGTPTSALAIKSCPGCWKIKSHIHRFLQKNAGRRLMIQYLADGFTRAGLDGAAIDVIKLLDLHTTRITNSE
jgi:hypothetical protein